MVGTLSEGASGRTEPLPVIRTIGQVLRTFAKAPLFFLTISLPILLVNLGYQAFNTDHVTILSWFSFLIEIPTLLILAFVNASISYVVVKIREGSRPPLLESLKVAVRRYVPVLVVTVLTTIMSAVGLFLLVIPGLIAICLFAVSAPVCTLEVLGPFESIRRGVLLTVGSRWRIFALFVILFVLSGVIFYSVRILFEITTSEAKALILASYVLIFFMIPSLIILSAEIYVDRLHSAHRAM